MKPYSKKVLMSRLNIEYVELFCRMYSPYFLKLIDCFDVIML